MKTPRITLTLILGFLIVSSGCSINKMVADRTGDLLENASESFFEEGDLAFAREAMPANLKMIEGLHKASPTNSGILIMLAQGYCSYAFAFLEESEKASDLARARAFYLRGFGYGLKALPPAAATAARGNMDDLEKEVASLGKGAVPALFWSGYCLGGWVNLSRNEVSSPVELSRAEVLMRQVVAKDEGYYYGAAHIFYGTFYGARPKMLGGSPKKALEHFQRALTFSNGKFLMTKVYLAQFAAVPLQN